jgi:hypothetical protein
VKRIVEVPEHRDVIENRTTRARGTGQKLTEATRTRKGRA